MSYLSVNLNARSVHSELLLRPQLDQAKAAKTKHPTHFSFFITNEANK